MFKPIFSIVLPGGIRRIGVIQPELMAVDYLFNLL